MKHLIPESSRTQINTDPHHLFTSFHRRLQPNQSTAINQYLEYTAQKMNQSTTLIRQSLRFDRNQSGFSFPLHVCIYSQKHLTPNARTQIDYTYKIGFNQTHSKLITRRFIYDTPICNYPVHATNSTVNCAYFRPANKPNANMNFQGPNKSKARIYTILIECPKPSLRFHISFHPMQCLLAIAQN